MSSPVSHNRMAWNKLVRNKQRLTLPAREQDFHDPLKKLDAIGWLGGDVSGLKTLCLAAGGGKHSALYATAGADVTVVDLSPAMLELDRQVARERNLDIRIVETSMDDLSMLEDESFDLVVQPVSTCYIPDISTVYKEIARVTRPHGLYISQHKQPTSLQADLKFSENGYALLQPYYRQDPLPPAAANSTLREHGTHEYLHRWEQLIGDMCRSGFAIEDLVEPYHADQGERPGRPGHRGQYIAPYVRIKARRLKTAARPEQFDIWVPST